MTHSKFTDTTNAIISIIIILSHVAKQKPVPLIFKGSLLQAETGRTG